MSDHQELKHDTGPLKLPSVEVESTPIAKDEWLELIKQGRLFERCYGEIEMPQKQIDEGYDRYKRIKKLVG